MAKYGLSEVQVGEAFNKGSIEQFKDGYTSHRKYSGYEVGVYWDRKSSGHYIIISAWKRGRRWLTQRPVRSNTVLTFVSPQVLLSSIKKQIS